jgi:acetyl-CoA synthetase
MPMSVELPITMLACARIGVIHSVVFGGFSASACADRVVDSNSRVLITMDAYYRGGKLLDHKIVDNEACQIAAKEGQKIDKLLIWQRYPGKMSSSAPIVEGRDVIVNDELKKYYGARVEPEQMLAEEPLFLMYTSGTTGKPKGAQHGTGGYLAYVTAMSKYIQDIHPEDVYWCMADIGWITGHSFIVYGPLALCASSVIYEGIPTYPDAGRCWRIAQDLDVNIFHTAPTAIRALRKVGPDEPAKYNYHFKHMTTVGEPIEPEVWKWYHKVVGKGKAVIVDTYWQTETGGFLCATVPGMQLMKPGSAGPGVPGIHPIIFDENGTVIPPGPARPAISASRTHGRVVFRPSGATATLCRNLFQDVQQESEQQGLARLAVSDRRCRDGSGRWLYPRVGTDRRCNQRLRPSSRHQGNRIGRTDRSRSGRSGSCAGHP